MRFTNLHQRHGYLALTLAALVLSGCGPSKSANSTSAVPQVSVLTMKRETVAITNELPGRTVPYLIAQVRARVDGIVQKRNFDDGTDVKEKQILYQIDPAPYRAALASAEASLRKSEANLMSATSLAERYKTLIDGNAISKQAYDNAVSAKLQATADVASAKAALTVAQINLGYTNVVSPINGRSGISEVTQGAYVQGSTASLLNTVQQIDPMYVDLNQSSVAALKLRNQGDKQAQSGKGVASNVTLTLEDGSQYPLSGTLQFSGITVDQATGSVKMRAVFPNPKHILLPGMFVRARIQQGENSAAILVPIKAVSHNQQGQATVLIAGSDNKVLQRTIQTQNTLGDRWIVLAGLNEGERVIVDGLQSIHAGMVVQVSDVKTQTAASANSADTTLAPSKTNVLAQAK